MSDKTVTFEPVKLQDAIMFLWKLRNMVSNAEYELYGMANRRRHFTLPEGHGSFPPAVKEDDDEQDLLDEVLAENLFIELKDSLVSFVKTSTGITVRDGNNNDL